MKKNNKKISLIVLVILLLALFSIAGCFIYQLIENNKNNNEDDLIKVQKTTEKEYHASFIGFGDALLHDGVYLDAATGRTGSDGYQIYDFTDMFTYIKPIIEKYDLRFYNQETIIGGKNLGLSNYPLFNSPDEIGNDLVNSIGFNLVNTATNHTLDKGTTGALYSAKFWESKDNAYMVGTSSSVEKRNTIEIQEINGIKYALLGYTYGTNGIPLPAGYEYLVNLYSDEQAKKDIESVRDKVDVVIVSMHWGVEYTHIPTNEQKRQAEYLSSLGVDVIIGHHPHVIQPIEYVNDTLVFYSLGNFISAQDGTAKRVGMMAGFDINKTFENGKTTIKIENPRADLIWTYHQYYKNFKVIPFTKLNDSLLPGYKQIYEQYKPIITKYDSSVKVGV